MSTPAKKPIKFRTYGHNGTIHGTTHVDVETDSKGNVVSVWFRCQPLPFLQTVVGSDRAKEMVQMKDEYKCPKLHAVVLED